MLRHAAAFLALVFLAPYAFAVEFDTPIAIENITVTQRPGHTITDATILIDDGRIRAVGVAIHIPAEAERVDGSGLHAYAGFIDAASHMGMPEKGPDREDIERVTDVEQVQKEGPRTSMQHANRLGVWPHVGPIDIYAADEKKAEAYRKSGFTAALVTPYPDIISGYGDMIQLDGRPLRSATIATGLTQAIGFGNLSGGYGSARTYPGSAMGAVALLRQTYMDAQWYRERKAVFVGHPTQVERPVRDPALEAMERLLDRQQIWLFDADTADRIHHALDLSIELNQRIAIFGGKEAWRVKERLARERVPVIVSLDWDDKPKLAPKKSKKEIVATTASWTPEWENAFFEPLAIREERVREWEEQVNNARELAEAGVLVAFTTKDAKASDLIKNARTAMENGLTAEQLLAGLTTNPALIFGLDDQLGSVESGRLANLVLTTKPLDDEKSQIRHVFVEGKRYSYAIDAPKKEEESDKDAVEDDAEDSDGDSEGEDTDEDAEEEEESEPEDLHPWAGETEADRAKPFDTGGNVLLKNAAVLTVTQGAHDRADILVRNGKIIEIGQGLSADANTTVIDLSGYWVMPGIIDPHSHLAVRAINEWTQSITSEVRQADVVNHTQLGIHRALAGGVTTIHTMHGSANTMGGQNAVLKLKYNTSPRDMLVTTGPRLVKFALGENVTRARPIPRYPNSRMGVESVLRQGFNAALEYQEEWKEYGEAVARREVALPPRRDLRLEALSDILAGEIWVHTHCYRADEMLRLLAVAEDYGFRIATLQHVLEGYRVAPEMYAHGVAGSTFSDWWSYKKEAFDAIPYNAAMMMREGIVTSLNSDSADVIRRMNLEAAKMMRFGGLTSDEALRLITINPAIQIGLDSRIGSIEAGKDGDFAVFTRHPLDTFSRCVMTIVEGEVFFKEAGLEIDGTTPGPGYSDTPTPPDTPLELPFGEKGTYVIANATVHPVSGPALEKASIVIRDGAISAVGTDLSVPSDATRIDAEGYHVYPGLINAATQLGLVEISGISQTVDARELALFQPDLRSLSAVNPHSEHIPVARSEGITTTHVLPSGGVVSGQSGIVQLAGWTMPEMMRELETGLLIDLPSLPARLESDDREKRITDHGNMVEDIEGFFRKARHYADVADLENTDFTRDIRLEAMIPYVRGERPVFFRAGNYKSILEALDFAKEFGVNAVIVGGDEAWKCADRLAEDDVPVIITGVFTLGYDPYERYDAYYGNAGRLAQAGVTFAIATDGAQFARQLASQAGYAVAYGLSEEQALRSITADAAAILEIDDQLGTIETGKTADLIITTGSPLQASTRTVGMFLKGVPAELTSLHEESHERFNNRPDPGLRPTGDLNGPPPMRTTRFADTD